MTFWPSTSYSGFHTDQTFHLFHDPVPSLTFNELKIKVVSMQNLQRVWHTSRERFRSPGSVLFRTSYYMLHVFICDMFSRTCRVFSRLLTLNIHWKFPDFASFMTVSIWGPCYFSISFASRNESGIAWNHHWRNSLEIQLNIMNSLILANVAGKFGAWPHI